MKTKNNVFFVLALTLLFGGALSANEVKETRALMLNQDCDNFYSSRRPEKMTIEGLNELIDHYSVGQVSHVFINANAMRTGYRTSAKGWQSIWDGNNPDDYNPRVKRLIKNALLLYNKGIDGYAVLVARCRKNGISPWMSMRMNDIHHLEYGYSAFWKAHPEYRRVPGGKGYYDIGLDYSIKEVRQYHMALVREYFERYDADGVEFDWLREPRNFAPGKEAQGREILTEFMREVRKLANEWAIKRGHPVGVSVRVPAVPEAAYGLGLDAVRWAKEGLIDILVVSPR